MASLPTVAHLVPLLPAGLALALMPGPNNLLSVQVAASDGVGAACRAGLGRLLAFALLLLAAAFGLAAVLRHAPAALALVQTAAAGYLLAIAGRLWREAAAPPAGDPTAADVDGARRAWCREFLVALGNPKCLLIATAFVPQCVDPARPAAPQLVAASLLVLALELLAVAISRHLGLPSATRNSRRQARRAPSTSAAVGSPAGGAAASRHSRPAMASR